MKKILILLIVIFTLTSCSNISKEEKIKNEICQNLKETTGDNFYFLYGLDKERSIATNVKYRGIVYSDRLEKLQWPEGLEIALEDLSSDNTRYISSSYKGLLRRVELDSMTENKTIEIFGQKVNLYNDWTMTKGQYNYIKTRLGKKNLPYEEKNGARSTIVNYFVEDLDKLNNEDVKQKTYELGKFIYDEMNYITALQVYVRDNKFFENYSLVYGSIYKPFRERTDIKEILKKIKKKEKISEEEKMALVRVFNKGSLDYQESHLKFFLLSFNKKNKLPIVEKNVSYEAEIKNKQNIFLKWRDEK